MSPAYLQFSFPPQWHYDVLRALDHFRPAIPAQPPDDVQTSPDREDCSARTCHIHGRGIVGVFGPEGAAEGWRG